MKVFEVIHMIFDFIVEFFFGLVASLRRTESIPPVSSDMLRLGAMELAAGIRAKRFTSESVVRAYIRRIKEVNPVLNALVNERFDDAIDEARHVDENLAGYSQAELDSKPLLGVPFTAKESTLCKGMACTFGLKQRAGMTAKEDATIIANMRRAGAILLGVTNVPQLNLWVETHNPVYGTTRNPYDASRQVGGSSGGEASLIAACGSPLGVGTDIGGSIRIPAYMCGIFGHKCSNGLTDTKGLTFRTGGEKDKTMVSTGPLARKAADLIPSIKVLLGEDANVLQLDTPVNIKTLKYFFIESNGDMRCSPLHADVQYVQKMVVDHFKRNRTVEKLEIPMLKYSSALYKFWMEQEGADFAFDITNRTYRASAASELWRYITWRSEFSFSVIMNLMSNQWLPEPKEDWAHEVTNEIKEFLLDKLSNDGVLLYPSWPEVATYHHVGYFRPYNFSYTSIFNVLKLPVTQVPLGLNKDGLPMGIQVVAGPNNDRLCIAVARELEQVFGGYVEPTPPEEAAATSSASN